MTVIAYRAGVMAADSMITQDGDVKMMNSVKIIDRKGWLLAVSGNACPPDAVIADWFFNVEDLDTYCRDPLPRFSFSMLAVTPKGKMQLWDQKGFFEPINAPFYAVGAGGHYAIGAMEHGATAIQAVKAAIKWSPSCGGRITVRHHRKTGK